MLIIDIIKFIHEKSEFNCPSLDTIVLVRFDGRAGPEHKEHLHHPDNLISQCNLSLYNVLILILDSFQLLLFCLLLQ